MTFLGLFFQNASIQISSCIIKSEMVFLSYMYCKFFNYLHINFFFCQSEGGLSAGNTFQRLSSLECEDFHICGWLFLCVCVCVFQGTWHFQAETQSYGACFS